MLLKTSAAYVELHSYISCFKMTRVVIIACGYRQVSLILKPVIQQEKLVLNLAKTETVTSVQTKFSPQFHAKSLGRVHFCGLIRKRAQKATPDTHASWPWKWVLGCNSVRICAQNARSAAETLCQMQNKLTLLLWGKGKAFPPQAWTGPWGSRRLRLQNF